MTEVAREAEAVDEIALPRPRTDPELSLAFQGERDATIGWLSPARAVGLAGAWSLTLYLVTEMQAPVVVRLLTPTAVLAFLSVLAVASDPMLFAAAAEGGHRRRIPAARAVAVICSTVALSVVIVLSPHAEVVTPVASLVAGVLFVLAATDFQHGVRPLRVACFCSSEETRRLYAGMRDRAIDVVYDDALLQQSSGDNGSADVAPPVGSRPDIAVFGATQLALADAALTEQIAGLYTRHIRVRTVGEFIEEFGGVVPVDGLSARWFVHDVTALHKAWYRRVRTVVDVIAGVVICTVLAILLPFLALAIKLDSSGPVFYRQVRVGRQGRHFELVKFRSMIVDAEPDGPVFATRSDPRVTRVGALLRRTRLDELPQAWNLLKGDMTLIGPRPERPEFVAATMQHTPFYGFRHIVRPGLTGWAQVTEGYTSDLSGTIRKLERDLYYLRHQGLLLDVRIVLKTFRCMVMFAGR